MSVVVFFLFEGASVTQSIPKPVPAAMAAPTFLILATAYVTPLPRSGDRPYYEIIVAEDRAKYAVRRVLQTRDPLLFAQLLEAEGTDVRFTLAWRARRTDSKSCLELEAATPAPEIR